MSSGMSLDISCAIYILPASNSLSNAWFVQFTVVGARTLPRKPQARLDSGGHVAKQGSQRNAFVGRGLFISPEVRLI